MMFAIELALALLFAFWVAIMLSSIEHGEVFPGLLAFYCAYITGRDILF